MQLELGSVAKQRWEEERARGDGLMQQLVEQQESVQKFLTSFKQMQKDLSASTKQNRVRPCPSPGKKRSITEVPDSARSFLLLARTTKQNRVRPCPSPGKKRSITEVPDSAWSFLLLARTTKQNRVRPCPSPGKKRSQNDHAEPGAPLPCSTKASK